MRRMRTQADEARANTNEVLQRMQARRAQHPGLTEVEYVEWRRDRNTAIGWALVAMGLVALALGVFR